MPQPRRGTAIAETAADPLASKLYEVAYQSVGPLLYIATEPDKRLDIMARAVREAGRRYPIVVAYRDGVAREARQAIHLGGVPAAEIRALPIRFGAAVICAKAPSETVNDELAALSGKLLAGADVLLIDGFDQRDGSELEFGALKVSERVGRSAVLVRTGRTSHDGTQADRRRGEQHRHSRRAELEPSRMGRDLEGVWRRARMADERAAGLRDELGRLSAELERSEERRAGVKAELDRARHERSAPAVQELEALGARLTRSEVTEAALAAELARAKGRPPLSPADVPVTVVIAVHDAFDELPRCIDSVLAHTPDPHAVLLIDDASTDARVRPLLQQYAGRCRRVTVLTNATNRGYTATINIGCDWAQGDVVLLNSDTEVAEGWLEGLRSVARSRQDVATVTPVSNAAGAFSIPERNVDNDLPEGLSVGDLSALIDYLSQRRRPRAPTGNGFCMYICREALDRVGPFDENAFPRGYGEENDFSQRAEAAGFVNLIDDATFVYHKRSASFAGDKAELIAAAKERLREKHPDYPRAVEQFLSEDPLSELRDAVAGALRGGRTEVKRLPASRPTILFVVHAGRGGTPETNRDLARSLSASYRCLTLSCDVDRWVLTQVGRSDETRLAEFDFEKRWEIREPLDPERTETLGRVIDAEQVELVHIRSFIATGPEVVGVVTALGVPVVCSLHDFYTVCPTIQLVDERERYCAGHCTEGAGSCPTSKRWVGPQPALKHDYVHRWRSRMRKGLKDADAFVTTSHSAKAVLCDHFDFMDDRRFHIIEHGRDAADFRPIGAPPGDRPRVVAFGALGVSKGTSLLTELLRLDEREGRAFEFHFIGPRSSGFSPEALGGVVHDAYKRGELPARLAQVKPSFALVTSIWPETYCHTLTEAWMADLPVFASDIGTLRERVKRDGGGWLLDHTDPEAFYAGMRAIKDSTAEWHLRRAEIAAMQPRTVDDMAADYRSLYRQLLLKRVSP